MRKFAIISIAIGMLTACGNDVDTPARTGDNSKAEGEVLGGSVSDAMLPLDQLQSQSASIERVPTTQDTGGDEAGDQEAPTEPATFEEAFGAAAGEAGSEGAAPAGEPPAPQPSE